MDIKKNSLKIKTQYIIKNRHLVKNLIIVYFLHSKEFELLMLHSFN